MTPPRDTLGGIDDAITLFEQALKAVRQIPKQGQHGVAVDGIEHELMALTERLRSLRDDVAGKGERAE